MIKSFFVVNIIRNTLTSRIFSKVYRNVQKGNSNSKLWKRIVPSSRRTSLHFIIISSWQTFVDFKKVMQYRSVHFREYPCTSNKNPCRSTPSPSYQSPVFFRGMGEQLYPPTSSACLIAPLPTKPLPRPLLHGFNPLNPFFYRPYMPRSPFTIPG